MREYIEKLLSEGEVRVIDKTVDPQFELAALTRLSQQQDDSVILFNDVNNTDIPVVSNVYGSRSRLCEIIGAEKGNFCQRWLELATELNKASTFTTKTKPEADKRTECVLSDLPQITYFEKDAGPYYTSAIFLAKNPQNGINNLSFHRSMHVSDDEIRVRLGGTHDLSRYQRIAEEQGEALPAALLIGVSPEIFTAACASLKPDEDELALASIIKGQPIEMTQCRSIDLSVPVETEIAVEGNILPGILRPEGPFGEFMGYYVPVGNNHVFEVKHVSRRQNTLFHALGVR